MREEPTTRGLLYFVGCFFPLQSLWQWKMYYDSRFYTLNDMWHNFYDVCTLLVLGTAVLHIRTVAIMSNPEEENDLFIFCLAICLGMLLIMGRSLEVLFWIDEGDPQAAKSASKRDALMYTAMTTFFAAATIYAGVKHYSAQLDDSYGGSSAAYYDDHHGDVDSYGYYNATNSSAYTLYDNNTTGEYPAPAAEDDHHLRFLAGDAEEKGAAGYDDKKGSVYSGDIAMYIMVAGYAFNHLLWFLNMFVIMPRLGDFRK